MIKIYAVVTYTEEHLPVGLVFFRSKFDAEDWVSICQNAAGWYLDSVTQAPMHEFIYRIKEIQLADHVPIKFGDAKRLSMQNLLAEHLALRHLVRWDFTGEVPLVLRGRKLSSSIIELARRGTSYARTGGILPEYFNREE